MKKILITAAIIAISVGAYGQGTIDFAAHKSGAFSIRVTQQETGVKLEGDNFKAQLYAGPQGGQLTAVGAVTTFRTGSAAGIWTTVSGIAVPGVAGGATATVQARAWEAAASWEEATNRGESNAFDKALGGAGNPPGLPATMEGIQDFTIVVPEPSTIALGILGALGLLALRRRK